MPSANPKLEKQASQEAAEPIRQAITVIEHKIRNLEKRKGKLESYKDLQNNGKDLDPDQKMAVAKYDVVVQLLDNTRDMYKQIVGIANEATKHQKKLARKEAAERLQQDIAKVREVLVVKETLSRIGIKSIRSDFLAGTNGAIKLTEEDLKYLDDFYNETTVNHQRLENRPSLQQQVQKVAEHFIAIVDGKQREVVGTTYNKIKKIISTISECGYFDRVQSTETAAPAPADAAATDKEIEEPRNEEFGNTGERHIPPPETMLPMPNFPGVSVAAVPVVSGAAAMPVVAQAIPPPVETSFYTNAAGFVAPPQQTQAGATIAPAQQPNQPNQPPAPRINDVIGTPNFFFLQESELDSTEVTTQAPIVSHIPPTVNAPIPTQTFTNQSFGGPPVVASAVIYPHQPPQDITHIPGFTNPNPPPPIPMPPSHQQPNMPFSPQHPAGFPQDQSIIQQGTQFEAHRQDNEAQKNDIKSNDQNNTTGQNDHGATNEVTEWSADTDVNTNDWNQPDDAQQTQDSQSQPQQGWGEQRSSGFRGRGNRRGSSSNGYGGRSRSGGFQQNSRGGNAGGGQGSHYRSENSSYQNGYHRWSNFGSGNGGGGNGTNPSGGYSNGFKSRAGGPRGAGAGARGERNSERGEARSSGQFRGGQQRGSRGGYAARSKPQAQQ